MVPHEERSTRLRRRGFSMTSDSEKAVRALLLRARGLVDDGQLGQAIGANDTLVERYGDDGTLDVRARVAETMA